MISIFKKGRRNKCRNYRGITLTDNERINLLQNVKMASEKVDLARTTCTH